VCVCACVCQYARMVQTADSISHLTMF